MNETAQRGYRGKYSAGFTMVELLLVLGITMIAGFAALILSIPFLQSNRGDESMVDLGSLAFRYQQDAYAGSDGKSYGVYFDTDSYVVFVGDSYATAESSDTITLPAGVTFSEISFNDSSSEVVFPMGTLTPSTYGYVRALSGPSTYVFEVNQEGLIQVYEE